MGIRFQLGDQELEIFHPDGQKFLTTVELEQLFQQEKILAQREKLTAQLALAQLEEERKKAEKMAAYLRQMGINPDELS